MKISTKGRYALRLVIDLAMHTDDGFVTLKDIAEAIRVATNLPVLLKTAPSVRYSRSLRGILLL